MYHAAPAAHMSAPSPITARMRIVLVCIAAPRCGVYAGAPRSQVLLVAGLIEGGGYALVGSTRRHT